MARYVILEIDDNEAAYDLVKALQSQETPAAGNVFFYKYEDGNEGEYKIGTITARVRGLFGKPTTFCECTLVGDVVRGEKFNWFTCTTCRKSRRGWQYPKNLLQEPKPSRIEFARNQMERLGFMEGHAHNPERDFKPPVVKGSYRGKR